MKILTTEKCPLCNLSLTKQIWNIGINREDYLYECANAPDSVKNSDTSSSCSYFTIRSEKQ